MKQDQADPVRKLKLAARLVLLTGILYCLRGLETESLLRTAHIFT